MLWPRTPAASQVLICIFSDLHSKMTCLGPIRVSGCVSLKERYPTLPNLVKSRSDQSRDFSTGKICFISFSETHPWSPLFIDKICRYEKNHIVSMGTLRNLNYS